MGPSYSKLHPKRLDLAKENGRLAEKGVNHENVGR